jgi:hypothetical protein
MAARRRSVIRPTSTPEIRSFGEDRICTASDCDTRLSRYNPDDYCFAHRDRVPQERIIRRLPT